MVHMGIKHGELTLLDTDGRPASLPISQTETKHAKILRGGLKAELQPLGLTLLKRAGIQSNDSFILVLDNDRTSVACMLAAMRLQCICPLVSKSRVTLLRHVKTQTGITKVLTVDDTTVSVSVEDDTDMTNEAAAKVWTQEEEIAKSGCICLFTSGSVGKPKVVACTWESMILQGESTHRQLFPKCPVRIICSTSICHSFAINTIFALYTSPYDAQSEVCFASGAIEIYNLLVQRNELFTALYGTPGTYTALATLPPTPLYADVPYCAGSRVSIPLLQRIRDDYGLLLKQNYGSTETGSIAAWNLNGFTSDEEIKMMDSNHKMLYVGSMWPGVKSQTTDEGEIIIETPWKSIGYVVGCKLHRLSGAYHSSDLGIITQDKDEVNCLWIEGRIRPAVEIESQGQRMTYPPEEIEAILVAHPHVTDALVLMQNDTTRRQGKIRARVVVDNNLDHGALDIIQWCINHDFPVLRDSLSIELVDFLPCSPAGKLFYS